MGGSKALKNSYWWPKTEWNIFYGKLLIFGIWEETGKRLVYGKFSQQSDKLAKDYFLGYFHSKVIKLICVRFWWIFLQPLLKLFRGGSVSVVSSQYQLSRLALTWCSVAVRWELQGCTHSSGAGSSNGGYCDTKNEGIGLKAWGFATNFE